MMKVLSIGWKDILIFIKDRGALITSFLLPLLFIVVFSYAFSGIEDEDQVITLPVVNLDGGEVAGDLIEQVNNTAGVDTKLYEEADARAQVEGEQLEYALIVPAGFSDGVAAGQPVTLLLISAPNADPANAEAMRTVVDGVAKDLSLQTQLIAGFRQMGQMMQASGGEEAFTSDLAVAQAQSQFERAQTAPLVAIEKKTPDAILQEREEFSAVGLTVPGATVLFVFLMASTTAMSLYGEKKTGTFRRLLAAPLAKAELLGGKMLPGFVIILAQVVVIFGASVLLLPLIGLDRLYLGNDIIALVVLSVLIALCSSSLGLLIAAIAKTEGQISGISVVAMWVMGAVSGAFVPTFFLGDFLGTIGKVTPHYWAVSAYTDLFVRGQTLANIGPELAILAGFTAVFFAIGLWRFKFE
ncbi:MAG: ABC transporter permease [Anaerolineae bacterium]|jgi:ABC-2 type transport system permease protein